MYISSSLSTVDDPPFSSVLFPTPASHPAPPRAPLLSATMGRAAPSSSPSSPQLVAEDTVSSMLVPKRKQRSCSLDDVMRRAPAVDAPPPVTSERVYYTNYETVLCETCGSGDRENELLLCDGCNRGHHTFCLRPIVAQVPVGTWFCPVCDPPMQGPKTKDACDDEVEPPSGQPIDLATPSVLLDMPHEIKVSFSERALFDIATKRLSTKDEQAIKIIADIGRHHVNQSLFGDAFRPRSRVGTFAMNVFCEALNLDYSANTDLKPSKFFFTSDIVNKLNTEKFEAAACSSYLSNPAIGFSQKTFDMVMIPVCKAEHWWLIVANLRDQRFDVLNSMKMDASVSKITHQICDNFRKVYHDLFDMSNINDKESFSIDVQPVPAQENNFDCGIYVMKFMQLWDGRKLRGLSKKDIFAYRQQIANYILRHPKNSTTTDDVKKCIGSKR